MAYSQTFIEEMKQALLAKKLKLQEELAGLSPHTELGDDLDDNADEINLDEVSKDLIARITGDLEKIDIALGKIEEAVYGVDDSGKEIGEDRLRAIPWADKAI